MIEGQTLFSTRSEPGWEVKAESRPGLGGAESSKADGGAKFRGLYVNGDRTVFHYRVGEASVYELPEIRGEGDEAVFVRNIRMGPSREPTTLMICGLFGDDADQGRGEIVVGRTAGIRTVTVEGKTLGVLGLPSGGEWVVVRGRHVGLKLPPLENSVYFSVGLGAVSTSLMTARLSHDREDPGAYLTGGAARWGGELETRGVLGVAGGVYEVDTIPLPEASTGGDGRKVTGLDFLGDGDRAALCTLGGDVWIVSGLGGSWDRLGWRRYASGLYQPSGLCIQREKIYVVGRDQITRLHDLNEDGEADYYEAFNNDVTEGGNAVEFVVDLERDATGAFYYAKAAPVLDGRYFDTVMRHHGGLMRVGGGGKTTEVIATGLLAPGGLAIGPQGEVTCSDSAGVWSPTTRINWIKRGGFYGCLGTAHEVPVPASYEAPICWIPTGVDPAPGSQVWVTSRRWGPFEGELLHLSEGSIGLFRVLRQSIRGGIQGGVTPFPVAFGAGAVRGRFNPRDGQLYVVGGSMDRDRVGDPGVFQRVRYTGKAVDGVRELRVERGGVRLRFWRPLDRTSSQDVSHHEIQWWNYERTHRPGSELVSPTRPGKVVGRGDEVRGERLGVARAVLSKDGLELRLETKEELKPVMQMMIRSDLRTVQGEPLAIEIYNTIHRVP